MIRVAVRRDDESRGEVAPLFAAVYPPGVLARVPRRDIQSTGSETRILVYEDERLVATADLLLRDAQHDGRRVAICGIGGVATLPLK